MLACRGFLLNSVEHGEDCRLRKQALALMLSPDAFCSALRDAIATGVNSRGFFKTPKLHINKAELSRVDRRTDEQDADAVLRGREKSLIKMGFFLNLLILIAQLIVTFNKLLKFLLWSARHAHIVLL